MIVVSAANEERVSEYELSELYGLSRAESRVALALEHGKRLTELIADFGVQITTLRTQLSSILKKCEMKRQADLVRLIGSIPVLRSSRRESIPYETDAYSSAHAGTAERLRVGHAGLAESGEKRLFGERVQR
jgi:DNA-binding CsgD family transcriptional regulator